MFAWLGEKGTPIFPLFTEDSLLSVDNEQDCECSVLNTVPYFSSVTGCISNQKNRHLDPYNQFSVLGSSLIAKDISLLGTGEKEKVKFVAFNVRL